VLTHDLGDLHFAWAEQSAQIEVYERGESGPSRRIGFLTNKGEHDFLVPFEQGPFEKHCEWFAEMASDAEGVTEDE
jgi:hypothetical protein